MGEHNSINIDRLIRIVNLGGRVKTGVDVYNRQGVLLIQRDVMIDGITPLLTIKKCGIIDVPIDPDCEGGVWDREGHAVSLECCPPEERDSGEERSPSMTDVSAKLKEIGEIKKEALVRYEQAKKTMQQVILQIREKEGEFDYEKVESTVSELLEFMESRPNAFGYLSRSIFDYDEYLYNHSVNVCTIGTAVLLHFNQRFSSTVNNYLKSLFVDDLQSLRFTEDQGFTYYFQGELLEISTAFFLHDIGKVLIPGEILNKNGPLDEKEFAVVKTHSYEKGPMLLAKNNISSCRILETVTYHHAAIYAGEFNTYPTDKKPEEVPIHVRIVKLADIYDAITSKRAYKEAMNPVLAVAEVFRKYANRNVLLQFLVHSFVKSIGVYPPGSVIRLCNGQMAIVLDGERPIVLPFTDAYGNTLAAKADPIDLGSPEAKKKGLQIDRREAVKSPIEALPLMPEYLKPILEGEKGKGAARGGG